MTKVAAINKTEAEDLAAKARAAEPDLVRSDCT